jgi:tetratricopeptide (TPR) repeat protein
VLGAQHPDTLASSNELATALQELERYGDAEPLFRAALDARLATLGESHQYTRNSMSNLGLLYSLWGRLDQAAPLYERALAVELELIGDGHPDTLALMHNIAGLYRKQGRLVDAQAMHRRVLEAAGRSPQLRPDAWQTALFRAGFALTLQQARDYAQGERELQRAIAALEATLGTDHARTVRAREMLAALRAERDGATPAPAAPR